jgi:hypothetical protein
VAWENDVPLETVANRSDPMACGPNVDQSRSSRVSPSRLVADACGAPVLRDQGPDRPAGHGKADASSDTQGRRDEPITARAGFQSYNLK